MSYADPTAGHVGTIYQATGWLYLGLADATGYLDLGDGVIRHPRTVGGSLGSQSVPYLRRTGVPARRVRFPGKHRYLYLLDPSWRWRVRVPVLPYPVAPERQPNSRPVDGVA